MASSLKDLHSSYINKLKISNFRRLSIVSKRVNNCFSLLEMRMKKLSTSASMTINIPTRRSSTSCMKSMLIFMREDHTCLRILAWNRTAKKTSIYFSCSIVRSPHTGPLSLSVLSNWFILRMKIVYQTKSLAKSNSRKHRMKLTLMH